METYKSKKKGRIESRVKKAHSKAGFAGVLYLLGSLALLVFSIFPMIALDGEKFYVVNFYEPLTTIMNAEKDWYGIVMAAFYSILLLVVLVNFFRCLANLSWLTKRSVRYVNGYNRNMRAMEKMGKAFSSSFAAFVILYLQMILIQPEIGKVTYTMWSYITLGAAALVHFVAGLVAGKVSYFDIEGMGGNVEEEKRECGLFVYFFRNLIQIAAVAGILYFFVKSCEIDTLVASLVQGVNPFEGKDIVYEIVPMGLHVLILLCLFVMIKHATAATEFNRMGIEGSGMMNFRVFSLFVVLLAGGTFVLEYLKNQTDFNVDFIIVAGIALVAFLVDCIFKSKRKKEETEEELQDEPAPYAPMPAPMQNAQGGQLPYQPIYVPIYYYLQPNAGYPEAVPVAQAAEENVRPAPTPAPAYLQPTPAPTVESKNELRAKRRELKDKEKDVKRAKKESKVNHRLAKQNKKNEEKTNKKEAAQARREAAYLAKHPVEYPRPNIEPMPRELDGLDPYKQWKVRCPICGKVLMARDSSPYHRCPNCDKVFTIRKFETFVKKDEE